MINNFSASATWEYCRFEVIAVNADCPRPRAVLDDVNIGWPLMIARMIVLTHNIAPVHNSVTPPVLLICLQNAGLAVNKATFVILIIFDLNSKT